MLPNAKQPRPKPEPGGSLPGIVEGDSLYTLSELAARLRWRKHSIRQAVRAGLRVVRFGSRNYCLGSDALAWFEELAKKQTENKGT